jgi:hypothetical protein
MTIAQEPSTAAYDGMPRSAILSGFVDYVLRVDQMANRLKEYADYLRDTERLNRDLLSDESEMLSHICLILKERTGHDFSYYKPNTLIRRIRRRLRVTHTDSLHKYLRQLRLEETEPRVLCRELLIGVTQFFRDTETFATLEREYIPELFENKDQNDRLRVWIPGCSTGEEAYSIAILIAEYMSRADLSCPVQIFATDIDDHSLETARRGWYPQGIADHVSPERLERHFNPSTQQEDRPKNRHVLDHPATDESMVRELENDLRKTKEDLHTTIEELESSNEELKSSNEELMSINEEHQSANEELQTSKEELQSVNEELHTINSELSMKLEELNRANDDIENLLKSTDIATIFLGEDLSIKRFTPAARTIFPLVDSDLGRPITDIHSPFQDINWNAEVRSVILDLAPRERQIQSDGGEQCYILRILP